MTTISAVPTLDMDFLQPEDSMELGSSPHMQQDDLDLDLDTAQEPEVAPEVSMVEDAIEDEQTEAEDHWDDDVMLDEDAADEQFPEATSDLHMDIHHNHETALEDEEILYEDDEVLQDSDLIQPTNNSVHSAPESNHAEQLPAFTADDVEVSDTHIGEEVEYAEQDTESPTALSKSHSANAAEVSYEQPIEAEQQEPTRHSNTFEAPEDVSNETQTEGHGEINEPGLDLEESTINTNLKDTSDTAESLPDIQSSEQDSADFANFSVEGPSAVEQHTSSLDTQAVALHTVKVIYQENEICLFPPHSEEGAETFFLSEHGLAHEAIDKLLAACREVLADTIGDDDELVLDVASLGLHISEGSKYAAEITLSQILDVYLRLSHNDGIEQVEPLYCSLSSRVCLASQYAYLAAAAQEGKTITEIVAEHEDSPEFEAFEEEPGHEEPTELNVEPYEVTETSLPAPDQSSPENAHRVQDVADAEAGEALKGQNEEQPEVTEQIDESEAGNYEVPGGITNHGDGHQTDDAVQLIGFSHGPGVDDIGIEPVYTEYQDDIDEIVNDDRDYPPQEQSVIAEQHVEIIGVNDETTSSGTVEAEANDDQAHHPEDTFEHGDNNFEHYNDGNDQHGHETNGFQAHDEHPFETFETKTEGPASNEPEDDLLDLEPEDQEQPSVSQLGFPAKFDKTDFQEVEDNQGLFDEEDASTEQTLDNTEGDDEDDLDVFLPPATPAKTRSGKRKVEADEEDDFDLLDTATPDKKRRRPS